MELAADITADDLKVFLQEADEILLLLDECILKLERDGEDSELIQEIFRAAHTLKGSSAMLGFPPMTELGHAMETLLDKIRKGTAKATTQVVNALLHSLDLLQALKDSLETGEDTTVDTSVVVAELERAGQVEGTGGGAEAATSGPLRLEITGDASSRVHSILESGEAVQRIQVLLRKDTDWAAVRCFQILNELLPLGEVLVSVPTQADIEAGENVGSEMLLLLATGAPEDKLQEVIKSVEDVEEIKVTLFTDADLTASAPEQAPTPISKGQTQAKEGANAGPKRGAASSQTVRIDVERLDGLMNMIGELVIDRTRILQIAKMMEAKHPDDDLVDSLTETSTHIVKVVDQLQEDFMKVRMLPIGTVFSGFPRMLRDMAQKMEKPLDFQIDGQDTEIDRTVIERIRDPLVHLLRNALDHGVEDPEARKAAGKDATATIKLSAHHEQNHIIITVEDDGKGISAEGIRASAIKKGLISPETAARLSEQECLDLIFLPGFSTKEQATEVSGRGVGMDIVKTNIQAINGFVKIDTELGKGTRITLSLPLTLATLQALLVSLGNATYAIPLVYVLETVKPADNKVHTVAGKEVMRLRDHIIPLIRLKSVYGCGGGSDGAKELNYSVVVRSGERMVGLIVDDLIIQQEIVVKSLGEYIGDLRGIAGASVLGDGQVVLIVDVPSLIDDAVKGEMAPEARIAA